MPAGAIRYVQEFRTSAKPVCHEACHTRYAPLEMDGIPKQRSIKNGGVYSIVGKWDAHIRRDLHPNSVVLIYAEAKAPIDCAAGRGRQSRGTIMT